MIPMHLLPPARIRFVQNIRRIITNQYRAWQDQAPRTELWNPPAFPLGDPHPLIQLLAIAKHRNIKVDVAYCANGVNCYSFLHGQPGWVGRDGVQVHTVIANLINNDTGIGMTITTDSIVTGNITDIEGRGVAEELLHTHCIAEVGGRKERGGGRCGNCGLYEDCLSPPQYREEGNLSEIGGVRYGPAIGKGRTTVGSLCSYCVENQTCEGCNVYDLRYSVVFVTLS